MAKITSVRDLRVWQKAMGLAMRVFEMTKRFPPEERFSLADQMRRASRSVATNIAEAWRKGRYEAAFISKLNDSEGEAAETQTGIEIARRCRYIDAAEAQELDAEYKDLLRQLVHVSTHTEGWVIGGEAAR
jgi:four helix bundle protein